MPATTADQELWLPAGVNEWSFDVLRGGNAEEMDAGDFDNHVPGTLEWEGGMPWRPDEANFLTWDSPNEARSESRGTRDANIRREEEPKQEDEDEVQILDDSYEDELEDWGNLSSSPELGYEASQSSNQRSRDRSRNEQQEEESESALPLIYRRSSFDPQRQRTTERPTLTLPPISDMVVDLTASSPSQLMTSLAPRSYNSRSPREPSTDNLRSGANSHSTATMQNFARQRAPSPKRRRTAGSSLLFPPTELSPILPSTNQPSNSSSSRNSHNNQKPPQRTRPTLPPISDYLNMTSEAEMIDLRDVDELHELDKFLSKEREATLAAQNAPKRPEEKNYTKSEMTYYKCPVCMDVLTNATATACGHLFCHKCIIDTLKFGERRAEEEGKPPKGNCPVCRKPISRNERPGSTKQLIQLKLMTRGKKKELEAASLEKGKGKEVDSERSEMKRKRSTVLLDD